MILYPAIDLKDGACVRLIQGNMDQATQFSASPGDQAAAFEAAGFRYVHVVDLNGAFAGEARNAEAVSDVLNRVNVPVQLGGGIRTLADIERWLASGVTRVILGTIAARNPDLVRQAAKTFPDQIVVGLDAKHGYVAVNGWGETEALLAEELAKAYADSGVAAIIVTDISRDGLKKGLNLDLTAKIADASGLPTIASGGLKSLEDIRAVKALSARHSLDGAILGRALYDGDIEPEAALAAARGAAT